MTDTTMIDVPVPAAAAQGAPAPAATDRSAPPAVALAAGAVPFTLLGATQAMAQSAVLGPNSTGSPGPGPNNAGLPEFNKLATGGPETYDTFGCKAYADSPPTPDWVTATVWFDRKIDSLDATMPDGNKVKFWVFRDLVTNKASFPSPMIRVQQGNLVHVRLKAAKGAHTIHHHGIEPSTFNDGVGHVSFEVGSEYVYQWQANSPGTWFYHCHVNTPLHFQMGLYGPLIVDPKPNKDGKIPAYEGGPTYDVEKIWAIGDVDPRWHNLEHGAGLCGEDVGLNIFEPKYFLISGVPTRLGVPSTSARVSAKSGQKVLLRLINAAYSPVRITIDSLEAHIIAVDGHPLDKPWNDWVSVGPTGEQRSLNMATATRFDVLIDLGSAANRLLKGSFKVHIEHFDWITWKRHNAGTPNEGYSLTTIDVA